MLGASRFFVAPLFLGISLSAFARAVAPLRARHGDTEQDLLAHIQREQNPVRKAKYQIRLGQLKLQQAIEAYGKSDFEPGRGLLDAYLGWMKEAWEALRGTGREASRQPQGFRELDIALRENARSLVDLQHRVPYADRGPVDRAAQECDKLRSEVLAVLFPREQLGGDEKKPPERPRLQFTPGSVRR